MRSLKIHIIQLFFLLISGYAGFGQIFNSYPSETSSLDYNTVAHYVNGVTEGTTFTVRLEELNNSRRYTVNIRCETNGYNSALGTIPVDKALIQVTNITSSASNRPVTVLYSAGSNIPMPYGVQATSYNPVTGPGLMVHFQSHSNQDNNDIITITFRLKGIAGLAVAGNNTTSGQTYGTPTIRYDLWESNGGFTTYSRQAISGSNHKIRFRIKDVLSFAVNNNATTVTVDPSSTGGEQVDVANQFTIVSNENVSMTVRASSANLISTTNPSDLISSTVFGLKVYDLTNTAGNTIPANHVTLNGTSNVTLASVIARYITNNIGISYKIVNVAPLAGKPPALYRTTLTFTVTQL